HLVTWLKNHQLAWLDSYLEGKVDPSRAYKALLGWCQAFAHRHGFSQRVPCASKRTQEDLQATRIEYAQSFWSKYDRGNIINIDETGVHYEMPIRRKLPPCIIVRGQPGGPVEQDELPTYPRDAIYAVQENAWMDERVWDIYLRELVQYEIEAPSVAVVDNLSAHVTPAACELVRGDLYSVLEELPANATSTVQRLEVGVMGPFKAKCRTEWLHEVKTRGVFINGKIEMWPFVRLVPAARNPRNRPAGTMVTKLVNVDAAVYRDYVMNKVVPAIKPTFPSANKRVVLQHDNATPHGSITDAALASVSTGGLMFVMRRQPPDSPDQNVLDLGFFASIQSLQYKKMSRTEDDVIRNTLEAFDELN
ncbi:hypothetical protein DYB26_009773, partial [Aphanomyces astaci]